MINTCYIAIIAYLIKNKFVSISNFIMLSIGIYNITYLYKVWYRYSYTLIILSKYKLSQQKKINYILIYSIKIILYELQSEKFEKVAHSKFPAVLYIIRKRIQKKFQKKSSCKKQEMWERGAKPFLVTIWIFGGILKLRLKWPKFGSFLTFFRLITIFISF